MGAEIISSRGGKLGIGELWGEGEGEGEGHCQICAVHK